METELELLNAARRMDQEALVRIFDLYASALFKYALRLCGDPVRADHLVGDVFIKFLEQLSQGKGPTDNLRSYLYQTLYHQLVDEARLSLRSAPLEAVELLRPDTHAAALSLEEQILFKQILDTLRTELTADQRHVIILRFLEDFSLRETAVIMGKTIDNIKVIQNRALEKLRKSLDARRVDTPVMSPRLKTISGVLTISSP